MQKNVLIIDDSPDYRDYELLVSDLEEVLNNESHIQYTVNLNYVNPNDYNVAGQNTDALSPLFEFLEANFLNKKLDLFMCDFNLHNHNKDLAFNIIGYVRTQNKSCSVLLYSGSPLKELVRINNQILANQIAEHIKRENPKIEIEPLKSKIDRVTIKELPSDSLLRMVLESDITRIVPRNHYKETALDLITKPSLLLRLENDLLAFPEGTIFRETGFSLDGVSLSEICRHIRAQTDEGTVFCQELIEMMTSHYLELVDA